MNREYQKEHEKRFKWEHDRRGIGEGRMGKGENVGKTLG